MDQGLAAVLGALVGAVATGGGAFVTVRSGTRLQQRQARREACRAFMSAAHRFNSDAMQILSYVAVVESELQSDDAEGARIREHLLGMLTALQGISTEVQTHTAAVMLEGPPEIIVKALSICGDITRLTAEIFGAGMGAAIDREPLDTLRQKIYQETLGFGLHANSLI